MQTFPRCVGEYLASFYPGIALFVRVLFTSRGNFSAGRFGTPVAPPSRMTRWTLTHDELRASPATAGGRSLLARIKDGTFDESLFYRLNALHVVVDEVPERYSRTGGHVT
jgi:hypothetical protein